MLRCCCYHGHAGAVKADGYELQGTGVVSAGNDQKLSGEKPQNKDRYANGQAAEHEALRVGNVGYVYSGILN